jgi:anti-repressor protein|nr:MAG TPA: regulatory protein [Caudoviricetes sp.]
MLTVMNDLVFQNSNGNDVTTSLIVAEVFGKEHSKVVRDIESLSCSASFNAANFGVITYTDSRNREQTAYEMTKDGFSFLVMGYTGAKAGEFKERFINEFNRRESLLKDDDYILMRSQQILQKRLEASEEKIKELEAEKKSIIEETKPAVVFTECVKNSPTNILVRDLAKLITQNGFKIGEYRLYDWLVEKKYLIRHKRWSKSKGKYDNDYTPTQKAAEMFLFFVTENAIMQGGTLSFIKHTCYVTGKGQVYFLNKFKELSKAA